MAGEVTRSIVLLGTLDTKGAEYDYLRQRIRDHGGEVTLVDVGVQGAPTVAADIDRDEIAALGGTSVAELVEQGDRAAALDAMAAGAAALLRRLHAEGRLAGVAGLGGTGGSTLISTAMRALPVGVPKLLVSTVAAGDTRPYVGGVDMTMMYSVVDIAGINQISARILSNAAGSIAGMASAEVEADGDVKPVVGATMFGLTTPCVTEARARLEELGYEVLVFHATGTGGQALEALVDAGLVTAMLDATTTELADNLAGGVFSAGPERLTAAGRQGIPQVVSLGALDMVNFGPFETVPAEYRDRTFHRHNATVTLMRTTAAECAQLGEEIATKLADASGPVAVFVPLGGISGIAVPGAVFHDPEADEALISALHEHLAEGTEIHDVESDINAPGFGLAMADRLHELYREWCKERDVYVKAGDGSHVGHR
jgi:uncharacterized protein (UPF0261 family)